MTNRVFELSTSRGMSGIVLPLTAPWIITSRDDIARFVRMPWSDAKFVASREGKVSNTLDISLGMVALQENKFDSTVQIAAYHYDTSD